MSHRKAVCFWYTRKHIVLREGIHEKEPDSVHPSLVLDDTGHLFIGRTRLSDRWNPRHPMYGSPGGRWLFQRAVLVRKLLPERKPERPAAVQSEQEETPSRLHANRCVQGCVSDPDYDWIRPSNHMGMGGYSGSGRRLCTYDPDHDGSGCDLWRLLSAQGLVYHLSDGVYGVLRGTGCPCEKTKRSYCRNERLRRLQAVLQGVSRRDSNPRISKGRRCQTRGLLEVSKMRKRSAQEMPLLPEKRWTRR